MFFEVSFLDFPVEIADCDRNSFDADVCRIHQPDVQLARRAVTPENVRLAVAIEVRQIHDPKFGRGNRGVQLISTIGHIWVLTQRPVQSSLEAKLQK